MNASPLIIPRRLYRDLIEQLHERGGARKESGAFLLASRTGPVRRITAAAYYDDLDPNSLTGAITFNTVGYSALADLCGREQLTVVADVHTHPRDDVRQSNTDREHPMVAIPGHIALIMPSYAAGAPPLRRLGVHVLREAGQWISTRGRSNRTAIRHESLLDRLRPAGNRR